MRKVARIEDLTGEELNAVCFVMDYVEFHFNGPVLRSLSNPLVRSVDGVVAFPNTGSRDRLAELIGSIVEHVSVIEARSIVLSVSGSREIVIPLTESERVGPEAAHFVVGEGDNLRISVW